MFTILSTIAMYTWTQQKQLNFTPKSLINLLFDNREEEKEQNLDW